MLLRWRLAVVPAMLLRWRFAVEPAMLLRRRFAADPAMILRSMRRLLRARLYYYGLFIATVALLLVRFSGFLLRCFYWGLANGALLLGRLERLCVGTQEIGESLDILIRLCGAGILNPLIRLFGGAVPIERPFTAAYAYRLNRTPRRVEGVPRIIFSLFIGIVHTPLYAG